MSKAFDHVWPKGFISKIKCTNVRGDLLNLIESVLFDWQQRVVLNGQESEWMAIIPSVPGV